MEKLQNIIGFFDKLNGEISGIPSGAGTFFTFIIRAILPILTVIILIRCIRSAFGITEENEIWGSLYLANGAAMPLNHWENLVGRARSCDVFLEIPTVSRLHAAIIRDAKGKWKIYDLNSKSGIIVNGDKISGQARLNPNDEIDLGGAIFTFVPQTVRGERIQAERRTRPGRDVRPGVTFFLLTQMQILLMIQHCCAAGDAINIAVPVCFILLTAIMWIYYLMMRAIHRTGFEIETTAFFLTTIGMSITATDEPSGLYKHIFFIIAGIALFLCIGYFLRNLNIVKKLRWPIAAAGLILLGVNLLTAETVFGAKNWLSIGGIQFQPSEFVKICFVFAGAATLDRLFAKRNLILFIGFAGACVGVLALMSDFGTAIIFFVAYLVISFLRSGSFATILLSVGGAGFAGVIAISMKPYILSRFATWGKAWEFLNDGGYQQTRTMSAMSSGGLLGVGGGKGWLKEVFAADTDMVLGIVGEELGLIIAVCTMLFIIFLVIFAIRSAGSSRSSFYTIAACASVAMLIFQMTLNVFGSLDILPFTGVTFPFVSRGGSSLVSCWGMMAFIKAADTRQNASFAIKLPKTLKRNDANPGVTDEI